MNPYQGELELYHRLSTRINIYVCVCIAQAIIGAFAQETKFAKLLRELSRCLYLWFHKKVHWFFSCVHNPRLGMF